MKSLPLLKWNNNWFISSEKLQFAYMSGLICRSVSKQTPYGATYTFTTKTGDLLASFYKDDTQGFSSQAYGHKIPVKDCFYTDPIFNFNFF
jgi:hypothetical protein